jgi:hypothetical protein
MSWRRNDCAVEEIGGNAEGGENGVVVRLPFRHGVGHAGSVPYAVAKRMLCLDDS